MGKGVHTIRRVFTALDTTGKSAIPGDEQISDQGEFVTTLWSTPDVPADNSGASAPGRVFSLDEMHEGGTFFIHIRMRPGFGAPMHATDTIDYITMISGEITLVTETGETVLRGGDTFIDRGILHAWRNDGDEDAVFTTVTIPSNPVGAGKQY